MHRFSFLLFCLPAALLLAACEPEMDFIESSISGFQSEATLSGGNLYINFTSGTGTASVTLEANRTWTAAFVNDRAKEWCTLSTDGGGSGTAGITIIVKENPEYDERSASILFTCGSLERTIVVTQKQKDAVLLSSTRQDVGKDGGTITLEVQANIPFSYSIPESCAGWITPQVKTKGLVSSALSFQVAANEDVEKREGAISITSTLKTETVKVYQEGATPALVVSASQVEVSSAGGTFQVEVKSNVNASVVIPDNCKWLSEVSTKAMSTNTFVFKADKNESYDLREASITFRNSQYGLEETVKVRQDQKDVILCENGDALTFDFAAQEFKVKTRFNVEYQVKSSASWLQPVKTKALQEKEEVFSLEENTGASSRTAELTFTSEGHPDAKLTVKVTQEAKDPFLFITVPGLYGLEGKNYIKGNDGWNQSACLVSRDGSIRYRLLKASELSAVTLSGLPQDAVRGSSCTVHVILQNKAEVPLSKDYQASVLLVQDGTYWLKVSSETLFVVKK